MPAARAILHKLGLQLLGSRRGARGEVFERGQEAIGESVDAIGQAPLEHLLQVRVLSERLQRTELVRAADLDKLRREQLRDAEGPEESGGGPRLRLWRGYTRRYWGAAGKNGKKASIDPGPRSRSRSVSQSVISRSRPALTPPPARSPAPPLPV